jgi:hypothetical protein
MATMRIKPNDDMPKDNWDDHTIFTKKIGNLRVKPRDQQHIHLGDYTTARLAKGFSISLTPEPEVPDMVTADVITVDKSDGYELVLHIANYGNTVIDAEVWEME